MLKSKLNFHCLGLALLISICVGLLPQKALCKLEYNSAELQLKNADQINALVQKKIKKANDIQAAAPDKDDDSGPTFDPAAISQLRDAMRIALGRPDQDGSRATLFTRLRRELDDLNAFEPTLKDLTKEGIANLKEKSDNYNVQATYVVLLINLMAEIKPEMATNASYRAIIEEIRDAKIELSKELKQEEKLSKMLKISSPSVIATEIVGPQAKK